MGKRKSDTSHDAEIIQWWTVDRLTVTEIAGRLRKTRGQAARALKRLDLFGKGASKSDRAKVRFKDNPKRKKAMGPKSPTTGFHKKPVRIGKGRNFSRVPVAPTPTVGHTFEPDPKYARFYRLLPPTGACLYRVGELADDTGFWCGRPTVWDAENKTNAWCERCLAIVYPRRAA